MKQYFLPLFLFAFIISCKDNSTSSGGSSIPETTVSDEPPAISYTILNALPHDQDSYTEGFLMHDGRLYESSGAPQDNDKTRSIVGIVDPATGKIGVKAELDRKTYFGEGIAILHDKLYQLTWTNKKGFIYDLKTFKKLGEFSFPSKEGWGMTTDGKSLILSDGSSNLTYLDPATFKTIRIVGVTDNNGPVGNVNELEWVNGNILANVYQTPYIIRIDPNTGKVLGKADFSNLVKEIKLKNPDVDYMNGIAWDSAKNKIYITGKLWPNTYEVRLNN
ncbi:MAG TPA: glutamine cyclotransferase [Chitinophagaceae bacterium]|jgi:glutaminyl-peptide cyclotransferase|nr:glutamine cyclotransferase [Chitinophagaceae bacterium]